MTVSDDPETSKRVLTLQRTATLAIGVAAVAVLVAGAALVLAAIAWRQSRPAPSPQTLEAPEFVVRDEKGDLRGRWTAQGLNLVDASGRLRIGLNVGGQDGHTLTMFSKEGRVKAVLGLGSGDTPSFTLHDDRSRVRARVVVDSVEGPSVTLTDDQGNVVARLPPPPVTPRKGRSR